MTGSLAGRAALVTGAAHGIGRAIARRLAAEGAAVCIADLDAEEADRVAGELAGAWAAPVDIADSGSVQTLAAALGDRQGRLDILVNNAAVADFSPIDSLTMEHHRRILDIDLNAPLQVILATLPLMRRSGRGGRILNIASIMGVRGSPDSIPYSTAKGGVVNMTRSLACDLARDGITVNAICPGFINTRMALLPDGSGHEHDTDWFKDIYMKYGRIPLRRPGQPEDIAGPAYFFCSDDSAYVTGQFLLVDGGLSATF
jgi:NAD(P)-dependent dehydrogenase (short-subunit alcohol dehydrogenase family)